jgi:hypothetical protein
MEIFSPGNPLSLEITYPPYLSLLFNTINVTGTAVSQGEEIISVDVIFEFYTDWLPATDLSGNWSSWYLEFDTKILTDDGLHIVTARAATRHHSLEKSVMVKVDNQGNKGPVVNFTSHKSGDMVNGTITIEGTAFDYDGFVQYVDVRIGNASYSRATNTGVNWSTWSFQIDTTTYTNGTYIINVMAFDNTPQGEGYWIDLVFMNEDKNGDGVQNGEDGGDEESDDAASDFWLYFIIIVIFVIVQLLILILRRKKKPADTEEEDEFE